MPSSKKGKHSIIPADKPILSSHFSERHQLTTSSKINYYLAALLVTATFLLYGSSLQYPLVFDDTSFFTESTLERLGSSLFHLDLRWFSYASFGWTYNLFGQDWFWYRLGNLVLHAITSILLFVFFCRLMDVTQPQASVPQSRWLAFFGALIFALHPVAVYGVAYLVQRSIVMATLFGIATLLCYMEGLAKNRVKCFFLSGFFYFLAVFSKELSIMIPGVAAALTLLLHKPSVALIKKVWLPFSLYLAIGILVILQMKGVLGTTYEYLAPGMLAQLSDQQQGLNIEDAYGLSVITQGFLFFKYLLLWVIPYTGWMSVDLRQAFPTHFLSWPETVGMILFVAYPLQPLRLLLKGGRIGLLGFGLLFPWILYLTELSSVRIQEPFILYRSYLWMSGLPIVLLALPAATSKKNLTIILPITCLIAAVLSWNRLDTFSSPLKLWSDAIEKNRDEKLLGVERAYNNRGPAYMNLGQVHKAEDDFKKAIILNPKDVNAHLNLGAVYLHLKNFPAALQSYNTAINLRSDYAKAYTARSTVFLQMGRYADVLSDCQYALQLDSQDKDAYMNCSLAQSYLGNPQEALSHLDALLRIDPKNATAYYNHGFNRNILGLYQDAIEDYTSAIALNPSYVEAYVNRAISLLKMGRNAEALNDFNKVIQINPRNTFFYLNRGATYFNLSKFQEALNDYDKALSLYDEARELDVNYNKVLLYRGIALNKLGRIDEALKSFHKGCDAGNLEACKLR